MQDYPPISDSMGKLQVVSGNQESEVEIIEFSQKGSQSLSKAPVLSLSGLIQDEKLGSHGQN
jgi:hypothetical protein